MASFEPFFGKRREILSDLWEPYMVNRDSEETVVAATYFAHHTIIPKYFATIPWWLPDDVEPSDTADYQESELDKATLATKKERVLQTFNKIMTWLEFNWARHRITHRIMLFEASYGTRFCEHDHGAPCRYYAHRNAVEVAESVNPRAHYRHIRNDTGY